MAYVLLVLCLVGALAGAVIVAGVWPRQSVSGLPNLVLGLMAGTLAFMAIEGFDMNQPRLASFLSNLLIALACGGAASLGAGSLRNILRRRD